MAKGLLLSTAAPSTIKQTFANSSAVTRKYVAIVMLALSVALASLSLDIFREFDIVSILCMVLCLACAAIAAMAFQRTLHQELYRDNLARRDVLKIDLLRLVLISALLVVVCLLFGITAVVLQFLLIPIFGFSAVIGILEALAVLLGIMSFPLLATVFFAPIASIAPTAPSTSRSDKAHLHRIQNGIRYLVSLARLDLADIKKAAPIYVPLLIVTTAIFVLGAALHLLLALIPLHILHQILSLVLTVFLGVVWLAAIYRLMYDMVLQGNSFNWLRSLHLQTFIHRLQCVSDKATACMLSFVLVFSMLGMAPAAFAEELEKAASDPSNIADVYEPDQTEREDVQESPEIQTPDTQSESTSSGTDTSVDTTAPEKEVTPKPPQDLYPEDKIEGTPVYMEGEATVLQTSEKTFTTVIGGVDVAFEDEQGRLHAVDNTLDAKSDGFFTEDVTYTNRANFYQAALPDKMDSSRGFTITAKGHTIEFIPQDGDFKYSKADDNAIRFTEVAQGIDYQYTLVGSVIKEDIILNRAVDPRSFKTKIKLPYGLTVKQDDEGLIGIYSQDGLILDIAAPVAMDATGATSDNLDLKLVWENDEPYLVLNPDWDWVLSPSRAYPVRIDPTIDIAPSAVRVGCVEQQWPKAFIGENGYAYAGYDDGKATGTGDYNHGLGHAICRVYTEINYDFSYIMSEARIDSATFSLFQHTAYSGGASNFGLYRVCQPWNFDDMNWKNQESVTHELVQFQYSHPYRGYIDWDVRECVNNWVQGVYPQYGFCVKAENERWMQCELFANRNSANPPRLAINWSIPDPVDESISLNATTIALRTLTEHDADNKLQFDGVFVDGIARPRSTVAYMLTPSDEAGLAYASRSYKYPDSTSWQDSIPNATRYKDKLSNWQSHVFYQLAHDTIYTIKATATLDGQSGSEVKSDTFLIYKASAKDTLPYIASHYGTTLDALAADNKVQDCLVVDGNTVFIRNPKTADAYNPGELSEDQKKRIDSALMGRGKHCEYGFEPVNMNTGNFMAEITDATIADIEGDFTISRTYNSKNSGYQSLLGRNWSFEYDEHISATAQGELVYTLGDGKSFWFTPDGEGGYNAPVGCEYELLKIPYEVIDETKPPNEDGVIEPDTYYRYEIHATNGEIRTFDSYGMLATITSAKGLATTIEYDERYRLKSVTSPAGNTYSFTLDEIGRISSVLLPDGNTVGYTYDANGNLAEVKEATGSTLRYVYDENSLMTEWYDGSGNRVIKNTYDADGRVITQADGNGNISSLAYTEGVTYATDAAGNTTAYAYDDQYRTTSITYPDGFIDTHSYDEHGNLASDAYGVYTSDTLGNRISSRDANGANTTAAYDDKSRLISEVRADGEAIGYTYDDRGNLIAMTSSSGESYTYTYDELCRLISETDADGVVTTYAWSGANCISATNAAGNTTSYAYDAMGRCIAETDPLGNTSRTYYDALGRVIGEQDKTGAYTSYNLTASGLLASMTDPAGNMSSFAYDAASNITSMTDSQGGIWTYAYDALGNEISETNPLGATTVKTYDVRGRLISTTDPTGAKTTSAYDGLGRKISETNPQGGTTTYKYIGSSEHPCLEMNALGSATIYTYTARGDVASILTSNGSLETSSYALGGRISSKTDAGGLTTAIEYSPAGRPVKIDQSGHTYTLEYDGVGNVVAMVDPEGNRHTIENDAAGRAVAITDALGNTMRFTYDGEGKQTGIIDALGNTTSIEYDGLGNTTSLTDALGNTTRYTYNALGLVASITDAAGNTQAATYDAVGNLIAETLPNKGVRTYTYDAAGRPLSETDSLGRATYYTYDGAGNMTTRTRPDNTQETYAYNLVGQPISMTDAAGLSINITYDARGNITGISSATGGIETYTYDGASRLIEAVDGEGRVSSTLYDVWGNTLKETDFTGIEASYTYDAMGNIASATDGAGATKRVAYDAAYRAVELVERNGAKSLQAFDAAGRLTSTTDALGYAEAYTYDATGNIVSFTDKDGYTSRLEYDALARIIAAIDANGNTTSYTYDAAGNITAVTDATGTTETYTYDSEGQLVGHTDAAGNNETYEYDIMGNMVLHTDMLGAKTAYEYDAHGNLVKEIDAEGNATTYEVSLEDTVTKMTKSNGASYTYTYDKVGRMTSLTTPKGYTKSFIYGTFDDPIEERDNTSASTKYTYDGAGRLASVVDALGNTNRVTYDGLGNAIQAIDGAGVTTNYTYDALGRLASFTDGSGVKSTYSYDGRGNLINERRDNLSQSYTFDALSNMTSITDGKGDTTNFAYDGAGRMTSQIDSLGNEQTFEYDVLGNLVRHTDETGALTKYSYDAMGNITETASPQGAATGYEYDVLGRLKKVQDADGSTTAYGYDSLGNITEVVDALGKKTSYSYDLEGNLTEIINPSGASEKMEYDLRNRLSSLTTPDGATARYSYDALNNMVEKSYSQDADAAVLYSFDAEGRSVSRTDTTGNASKEYDGAGRLISETDGSGQKLTYTYDASGNLASVTYPDGTQAAYAYDSAGNIITVAAPEGEYRYEYDSENRPILLARPNGTTTSYSYDAGGRTVSVENKDTHGAELSSYRYTYDAKGNIETEEARTAKPEGGTHISQRTFAYTSAGKLAQVNEQGDTNYTEVYTYDGVGNRIHLERSGDGADAIDYAYDDDNRLVKTTSSKDGETTYTYDAGGNLASKLGNGIDTSYTYGVEGRLEAVREGGRLLMAATYDGDGNRATQASLYHRERQLSSEIDTTGKEPDLVYQSRLGDHLFIQELVHPFVLGFAMQATVYTFLANPATISWALDVVVDILLNAPVGAESLPSGLPRLVMDSKAILEGDKPSLAAALGLIPRGLSSTEEVFDVVGYVNSTLSGTAQVMTSASTKSGTTNETYGMTRLATTTESHTSYFVNDGRGSVVQTTNAQGASTSWKSYSAFGEIEASSNLGELPAYGYNAEEQHPKTGLSFMRFRYYEAKTSTFGVQDTYLGNIFSPLTLNRYLYCLANPVNYVDPTGHVSLSGIWNGVKNAASSFFNGAKNFFTSIGKGIANIGSSLSRAFSKGIKELGQLGNRLGSALSSLPGMFNNAAINITSRFLSAAREIGKRFHDFYCGLADVLKPFQPLVKPFLDLGNIMQRAAVDFGRDLTNTGTVDPVIDLAIGATRGEDGAYHIRQDWWQSWEFVGYNDIYDDFFKFFSNAWGAGAENRKFEFFYNGEKITLWAWKGDYLNLGAGSELGIYKGDYAGHVLTAPEYAMPMTLKVTNKVTGQTYVNYKPTDNKWWVTGFNPDGHNVPPSALESTVTVDFSSNPGMYEAFREKYDGDSSGWKFDARNNKATLQW